MGDLADIFLWYLDEVRPDLILIHLSVRAWRSDDIIDSGQGGGRSMEDGGHFNNVVAHASAQGPNHSGENNFL